MRQVIIIGGGPAGMSCAVQLQRGSVEPLLVSREPLGGRLHNAYRVENLLAAAPQPGVELVETLQRRLRSFGVETLQEEVAAVGRAAGLDHFTVETTTRTLNAHYVVLATGTKPKRIPAFEIPGRTFYEVFPMPATRGHHVVIVGSGEAAYDSALSLAARDCAVTVLTNKPPDRVVACLADAVFAHPAVAVYLNEPAVGVQASKMQAPKTHASGARLEVVTAKRRLDADYLLVAIGRTADRSLVRDAALIEHPDFFICGDAKRGSLGQVAISMGDGLEVAMNILAGCAAVQGETHGADQSL